jgi:DNA ligase-1
MAPSGLFNDMQRFAMRKDVEDKPGIYHMFDVVPIEEFHTGKSTEPYYKRRAMLEKFFHDSKGADFEALNIVSVAMVGEVTEEGISSAEALAKSEEAIMRVHQDLLLESYEGSMIKDLDGLYECKRGWTVQKVKDMDNVDLRVIDIVPGLKGTKYEHTMGALVVDYMGNPVNVGSGFSDEQRAEIWDNKEDVINRVIEVKYFEETKDKTGKVSLRFPIFIQFRYDKE